MVCNWGILGPGFVATRAIIPAIQQLHDARALAVASRSEERGRSAAQQFGIERVYGDYAALLDDADVDAVYIALPNHLHCQWTIQAARAGKHVLCEKPLAMNAAECDEMIYACKDAGVLLMEAVMYRFHPRMQYLKEMIGAGKLGELRLLHAAFSFPFQATNYRAYPAFGGGALLDVGSYCVNAVCWLVGGEPESVHGEIVHGLNGIDISASAVLRFNDGVLAHIQCSFAAAEHQVIEAIGDTGAVMVPLAFTAWRKDVTELVVQRASTFERIEFAAADPYVAMVRHFTGCVLGKEVLRYPAEDGWRTLRVLDELKQSSV